MARTDDEIEAELDNGLPDGCDVPTAYPGMTYEQGVDHALRWAAGWTDDKPMTEE